MTALGIGQDGVDAIRADGGLVHIRKVNPADGNGIRALHARASDRSIYLRFFSISRATAESHVATLIRPSARDHHALAACVRGQIVGVAAFERLDDTDAEISLIVSDECQHEGIGMLLLEHLASVARHAGIERFVADVLSENRGMIGLLRDVGFVVATAVERETSRVVLTLDPVERAVAAIAERDRSADAASLTPMLAPRSIAMVGVSDREGSVGHQVLSNILAAGYTGSIHVVNSRHASVLGAPCVSSPAALPTAPDLVIVAVPALAVADVLEACGNRGAKTVLLLSAGFGEAGPAGRVLQDEVLGVVREFGMRMVGPNCVGLVNTDPDVRLNATFAALPMQPGTLGLMAQSGAFGIALVSAAQRAGTGISQFVSVGNKADVSGNDLLLRWERDPGTRVIGMYLESFGDPQRFARIARRVSRSKPILAIKSGRSPAGQRAGQSHTAAAASSDVAVDAAFRNSGVLRMTTMQDMLNAARVLSEQPLPAGPRVAIIGNSGGPGILGADAAAAAGLLTVELGPSTRDRLRAAVPGAASTQNPVDLGAAVTPDEVRAALAVLLIADEVDAVLTVFTHVAVSDAELINLAVLSGAAGSDKPVVATEVGCAERSIPIGDTIRSLPFFTFPEPAAAALGVAYRYAQIRSEPVHSSGRPAGIRVSPARELVRDVLAAGREWLDPDETNRLLGHYGVAVCPQRVVHSSDDAVEAGDTLGYPVAAKMAAAGLHKSELGGVRLDLRDGAAVRQAYGELAAASPDPLGGVLIQPMLNRGTEIIVGVVRDAQFGPLVMLGAGGVLVDLLDDRAFRLAPLAAAEAETMVDELQLARMLDGYRGAPVVSRSALTDVLVRIAALADDLPEIAELDINPLIGTGHAVIAVDARIRVETPQPARDPLLRQLRQPIVTPRGKLS
jgi:acyl-CoA synthetase (NDP forming)/GNAT superfamily N-acetyltransferase